MDGKEGKEERIGKGEEGLDLDICPGAPEFLVTPLDMVARSHPSPHPDNTSIHFAIVTNRHTEEEEEEEQCFYCHCQTE